MCTQLRTTRLASDAFVDSARYAWLSQEPSSSMEHLTVANHMAHQRGHSDPSISLSPRRQVDEGYESSRLRHQKSTGQRLSDSSEILRDLETIKKALGADTGSFTTNSIARDVYLNKTVPKPASSITLAQEESPPLPLNRVPSLERLQLSSTSTAADTAQAKDAIKDTPLTKLEITSQSPRSLKDLNSQSTPGAKISGDFQSSVVLASEWKYIQDRRNDHIFLQSQLRGVRKTMRDRQSAKSVMEDKIFQRVIRKELGLPSNKENPKIDSAQLLELIEKYRAARDEYGPLQDDCDRLEDQVNAEGYQLNQLEEEFFAKRALASVSTLRRASSIKSEGSTSETADYGEDDDDLTYHPLVTKYLSKLGDLDIAQERLDEILDETEQLEEQRLTRANFGLSLGVEEQSWLDDSQRLRDEVEEEIALLAAEVENLKQQCLTQGLLDDYGDPVDIMAQEQERFGQEDGLDPGTHVSEYTKHPLLLQQPGATSDTGLDYIPDLGEESYTVRGRINYWLLDRLRNSALDVSLLAWTYEKSGGETSMGWQKSVLEHWYVDGTLSSLADLNARTFSMYHSAQSSTDQKNPAVIHPSFELDSDRSEYGTERTIQPPSLSGNLRGDPHTSSA